MYNLIAIGDPIIDTHVQIADNSAECRISGGQIEHLCFDYGSKIPIIDSFQCLGGNAPNVAVGATKLGLSTAIISTVGQDATGKIAVQELKKVGVDTQYINYDPKSKTRYSIVLNYKTERTILSYSDKKKYRWPSGVPGTDWIYYTGVSEGFELLQEKLISYLAKHPSVKLAVNPGSYMLAYAMPALKEIISFADVLIVNLEEAEKIAGTTLNKEKNVGSIIHKLIQLGTDEVALTDAGKGCWAGTRDEVWHLDAYPVEVVAKTGAGDAFSSGYLAAKFYGHDISHALSWGVASSSGVIQKHGAQAGLLDKEGIEKMRGQYPTIVPSKC